MIWTTTGNLTNVSANASFPFGVAMLPANKRAAARPAAATSTSSSKTTPAEQEAALRSSSG